MLLRKIRAYFTKEKYYNNVKLRSTKDIVNQLKQSQLKLLEVERKSLKDGKDYWVGRIETLKWVLQEK